MDPLVLTAPLAGTAATVRALVGRYPAHLYYYLYVVDAEHRLVTADCMEWLAKERDSYDLIFIDPPTFSNSKRMSGVFDVQRDHVSLLRLALARLAPGGQIVFSTNFRQFRLDQTALGAVSVRSLSDRTLPEDFRRNPKIHQAWLIEPV